MFKMKIMKVMLYQIGTIYGVAISFRFIWVMKRTILALWCF